VSCYGDALKLLGRRDLSVADLRARLADREHPEDEIDAAVSRLLEVGALNDARLARAYVRTASQVKGRGRLRIARELQQMGIPREVAAEALAEVFADTDERSLIDRALQKKLRGAQRPKTLQERARLYQFLMRQGFTPTGVSAAMRRLGMGSDD
jgi:regulatory protein